MKKFASKLFIVFLFLSIGMSLSMTAQTVYKTKTGKKYHTVSCRYLSQSSAAIELDDAKSIGLTSCSVCKPASSSTSIKESNYESETKSSTQNQIVYKTKSGKKYHNVSCRYLSQSSAAIELFDAKSIGLTPCSVCKPAKGIDSANDLNFKTETKSSTQKSSSSVATQCTGTTQKGARCKRKTKSASGRCYQH